MRLIRLYTLILALSASSLAAAPSLHAVLIGVGTYEHLDADLRGPPHDVALMAQVLLARGADPARVIALTTDPEAPSLPPGLRKDAPTRAAILSALAQVAAAAVPGDTVLVYFSGHGSQAPDRDGDEVSGYDQILLPMDARGWRGATGDVENAIYDDELQAWARGLLLREVQVVGIIDACHSGTGFRALTGSGTARVIAPETMGIPEAEPPDMVILAPDLPGEFVFLYASQADQRSFEYPLDPADPSGRWQGGFTLALARGLSRHPDLTWRQALHLARDALATGPHRQDPDGEGPLLDAPVFGQGAASPRFRVEAGRLRAGLLEGLAEGARVALFDVPAGGTALAEAEVRAPTATETGLAPPPPSAALWAEITAPAPPPPLRLATPVRADPGDGFDYAPWTAALAQAMAGGLAVEAATADLVPILTAGAVALAGADGVLDPTGPGSSPRIVPRDGETSGEATLRMIETAAHTLRLRGVLAGMAGRGLLAGGRMTLEVARRPGALRAGGCRRGEVGDPQAHDPARGVAPCDELWLTLTNATGSAKDVTLFYVAQDFTVTPLWPKGGLSGRLPIGGTARTGLRITPDTPTNAAEEILVVAVDADLRADSTPLAALATPDRLRATGEEATTAIVAGLLDPDTATRAFTSARPALTLLRQPVRITPPTTP
ncbi:MAG: caspase family protein [Gemmobacter sp.]